APFSFGLSYTYSHSIDNSSDRADADFVNSYNLASNRASSNFDQRHNASLNFIYALPVRGVLNAVTHAFDEDPTNQVTKHDLSSSSRQFLDSRSAKLFLDNWQLSGIIVFQTGTPFSIINGGSSGGIGVSD